MYDETLWIGEHIENCRLQCTCEAKHVQLMLHAFTFPVYGTVGSIEKDDIGNEHFMPGCYRNLMGFAQNLAVACTGRGNNVAAHGMFAMPRNVKPAA